MKFHKKPQENTREVLKPSTLEYGVNDKPPFPLVVLQGLQHVCIYAISLIFPVMIVRSFGGTIEQAAFLVSMSMIAGGVGVVVQGFKKGPAGSGYLCPQVCGPSFISASIYAVKTGGLSLLLGMTFLAGSFEGFFSRVIDKLRFFFPSEVTGLIVAMVGITVVKLSVMNFFGLDHTDHVSTPQELGVALLTIGLMIGLNVWSKGKLKFFCVLIGMIGGYLASYFLGLFGEQQVQTFNNASFVWLPFLHHPGWSFKAELIIPFIIAMLCSTLKSVGDLTTCQKINDSKWKRPDMQNIKKGILADSVGCMTSGAIGGMGQSTSSTNIGLTIATSTTSRVISLAMGGLLIVLAFFPKLASLFSIMPKPVMGATLIFSLSFMIVAGFQIIMSRMMDARKTFVVGIAVIMGLSVDMLPGLYQNLHPWIEPVFSSSLSTATITAVVLNVIFRIGISKKVSLDLVQGQSSSDTIGDFMEKNGRAWGARKEIIEKAAMVISEIFESLSKLGINDKIAVQVVFDEFKLNAKISYQGKMINLPEHRPSFESLINDQEATKELSGYLIRQYADKISTHVHNGKSVIHIHFEH